MDFIHAFVLSIIQGLTEFLPVSSSAHLILLPRVFGWEDQGLAYDIAAHFGSLAAVIIYFRQDLARIIQGGWYSVSGNGMTTDGRMFWYLIVASIPVGLFGYLIYDLVATAFRNPVLLGYMNLIFAALLLLADKTGKRLRPQSGIGWRDAILIGLAQALSLIPGASRSGVTITAGLMLGLTRQAAARFAFLMAIPVLIMASGYQLYRIVTDATEVDYGSFALVTVLSFFSALAAIHFFLKLLDRFGLTPYVVYRVGLGVVLLLIFT